MLLSQAENGQLLSFAPIATLDELLWHQKLYYVDQILNHYERYQAKARRVAKQTESLAVLTVRLRVFVYCPESA